MTGINVTFLSAREKGSRFPWPFFDLVGNTLVDGGPPTLMSRKTERQRSSMTTG